MTGEHVAVVCAILYLLLAIRQIVWCWLAAAVSAAIYGYLFFDQALYMVAGLQLFYIGMAVYGAWQWRRGGADGGARVVVRWPAHYHAAALAGVLALTLASVVFLRQYTDAAMPLLDSLTTWGSVVTTFMVARKVLENWLYWFVIDSLYVYIFLAQGMVATAGLFVLYLVLVVFGYLSWRSDLAPAARTEPSA